MAFVDDRGRLFGRFNLLDAILAIVLLGLIPLAYGAYALFRTPLPRLSSVEPASLVAGPNLRVSVKGENFRPYMRVSFNNIQGNSFIFRNSGEAVIDLNAMPPGVYDVVLYDDAQERSRLRGAFTLLPTPLPDSQVIAVGNFGNLTADRVSVIAKGASVPGLGTILEVGAPLPETTRVFAGPVLEIPVEKAVRVPATLRVGCSVRAPQGTPQCVVGDVVLQPSMIVFVDFGGSKLPFQIDQLRGTQPLETVTATVQFDDRPARLGLIARGDVDQGAFANELSAGARVTDISPVRTMGGETSRVDVTLTVPAQRDTASWTYASAPLRAGAPFLLRTPKYELRGTIVQVSPEWSSPRTAPAESK
jgi:hypothetical protein